MKKLNSGAGDPQPRLDVQETFLYIRESPAPWGMAWQPLVPEFMQHTFLQQHLHNVGPRYTRPVVALRKKGILPTILLITIAFATLSPVLGQLTYKKAIFPSTHEFQNSTFIKGKNPSTSPTYHINIKNQTPNHSYNPPSMMILYCQLSSHNTLPRSPPTHTHFLQKNHITLHNGNIPREYLMTITGENN